MSVEIDRSSLDKLFRLAYEDLLRLADPLAEGGKTAAFDPAEVVNQTYLDLVEKTAESKVAVSDASAKAIVARTMRAILKRSADIISADKRAANKLQIGSNAYLEVLNRMTNDPAVSSLHDALDALRELFPATTPLIQAKFYDALTDEQVAKIRGTSKAQVQREWEFTKLWLQRELGASVERRMRDSAPSKYQFVTGDADVAIVRVFYATDRESTQTATGFDYGYERSEDETLTFGECQVSIPRIHAKGKRESIKRGLFNRSPDPVKHMVLVTSQECSQKDFFDRLAESIEESHAKGTFVFVHGYNVPFEDAARTVAQLAFDLEVKCAPILYSWPSNGAWFDYTRDETQIDWTRPHFEEFLLLLTQYSRAERIHIIAHSMGNRAVCNAFESLSKDSGLPLRFNHLVLAAPDVDTADFRNRAGYLKKLSGRVTLYQSSNDKAMKASKGLHRYTRAGDPVLIVSGVDTVDASNVDTTDFFGHSYFSQSRELLADIHAILFKDEPPSLRFGLMEMEDNEGKYYAFAP